METSLPILTETPLPRQLSICLGKEPKSLFLYEAVSSAAKSVLAAIYDGPFDRQDFQIQPVILAKLPSLAGRGCALRTGDESAQARGDRRRVWEPEYPGKELFIDRAVV
jgi:peptide/nickel transport system substrate-binding protein